MKTLGTLLVVAGVVTIGVGVAGQIAGWGEKTEDRDETVAPTATSAPAGATTSTTLPAEDPAQFLLALGNAFRVGDTNFLMSRLNPAVIGRYGTPQCLSTLATAQDPSAEFIVKTVSEPIEFAWTTDERTVTVPGTLTVEVDRVQRGVTQAAALHLTAVDGQFTWFVDCGNPIGP
jgi:hypothetical protein